MELYTLNSLFKRVAVIDIFESLIWSERYASWGDFELRVVSTPEMRRLLSAGTRLAMNRSYRVMTVEMVEDATDDDGRDILKVSGRSLEAILEDRAARNSFANLTDVPKWELTGTPGDIARQIFNDICRINANFPDDEIPYLMPGSIFPAGTIPEPNNVITIEVDLDTVYSAIKEICDVFDLGFRLVRNFDTSELYFDIYTGNDRTTKQNVFDPVVFAPNLDNLRNTTSVASIGDYKNVAYVFHAHGVQIVVADGTSVEVEGFERRVLIINATDIDMEAGPELNAALAQKGREELAKHRQIAAFDGELPGNSPYPYEIAYRLGDLTELRNNDGVTNVMRVDEQIFVQDGEGERSYPTLVMKTITFPDTWAGWNPNEVWEEVEGYWNDGDSPDPGPTSPDAPAMPEVVTTTTTADISWSPPAENGGAPITQYEIRYDTDLDFISAILVISPTTTKSVKDLMPSEDYHFQVRARNAIGASPWSEPKTVTTKAGLSVNLVGPAGAKITIPTHVSLPGGQTSNPSVVDFGTNWGGYRYWMAHTPYPNANNAHSDPNIVASANGTTWVVPAGLTNPIDNQPGSPGAYNTDTDLVYVDGYLWLFWRTYVENATGTEERIFLSRSNNGTTWSPKVLIWQTAATTMRLTSPTLVFEDGAWTMWGIDIVGDYKLRRVRSKGPTLTAPSSWNEPEECSLPATAIDRVPWDVEIRKIDEVYIGMLNDRPDGTAEDGDLYMMRSLNGKDWVVGSAVAIPRVGGGAPGHQNLSRATFVKKSDTSLDVWYAGWNDDPQPVIWNVFRTTLTAP